MMANSIIEKIADKQAAAELAAFIESRRLAELQQGERLREYLDTRFDATPYTPDERGNLPPCPFCNGRALCRPVRGPAGVLVAWLIDCECGRASADGKTKTEAVMSWSRRTPPWVPVTTLPPEMGTYLVKIAPVEFEGPLATRLLFYSPELLSDGKPCGWEGSANVVAWMPIPPYEAMDAELTAEEDVK